MRHISLKNYIPVRKKYLIDVVHPALQSEQVFSTKTCLFAGSTIRINFYSKELYQKLFPAISHLEIDADKTDLTIHAWETPKSEIQSPLTDERYHASRESHAQKELEKYFLGVYLFGEETINLYDKSQQEAYFWTADATLLPNWVTAAPFRTILHWFLADRNISLVHGAVVGINGRAVLLAARGGSGKSTTALSCVLSGMDYLADDYAAIGVEGDEVMVYSLYNTVKIVSDMNEKFPEFQREWDIEAINGEKAVMFLSKKIPKRLVKSSLLTAILVPAIFDQDKTTIAPVRKIETVQALIPTTLFQLPLAREDVVTQLTRIIDLVPSYRIMLGEIRLVPDALKKFLIEYST